MGALPQGLGSQRLLGMLGPGLHVMICDDHRSMRTVGAQAKVAPYLVQGAMAADAQQVGRGIQGLQGALRRVCVSQPQNCSAASCCASEVPG